MERILINKLCKLVKTRKSIILTNEELECLLRISELLAQIEILEAMPDNKEKLIEGNKKELEEIFKGKHFKGFEEFFF